MDPKIPSLFDYSERDIEEIDSDQLKYVYEDDKEIVAKTIRNVWKVK